MESRVEREQSVLNLLIELQGIEALKKLFWSELNYNRVNKPLSRRDWNQTAVSCLTEDPVLFASGGQNDDFHVIYSRLPQDKLSIGQERPVVTQLLKDHPYSLFIFSNQAEDKWHFINVKNDADNTKRRMFRRISVSPEDRLRTAAERITMLDLHYLAPDMFGLQPLTIQSKHDEAFDVELVTNEFFVEYEKQFRSLEKELRSQTKDHTWAHDYSLQFLNRSMFIYFIQRKGWLGGDRDFLMDYWKAYQHAGQSLNSFVDNWLNVLFFEAFNNMFHSGHTYFPSAIRDVLALAPYLNGGLFTKNSFDTDYKAKITDSHFEKILKFLERFNFTIAEDSPIDKEVAVDPEMIGKVYESLVNVSDEVDERGEAGIFYTPRTEIDLMCRLTVVDNLANYVGENKKSFLYQLVFALEPDEKIEADKVVATAELWPVIDERLRAMTVLDPACGSGSFLVGMLNILDDLQERANRQLNKTEAPYERKKRIIGQSLYGVDVMGWACHTAELRLWLSLIIDAEIPQAELHVRKEPLLPHFTFKIRYGDSLVQEIGGVNFGHKHESLAWSKELKKRIDTLKIEKLKFYNNDKTCLFHSLEEAKQEERSIFQGLLDHRIQTLEAEIKMLKQRIATPQTQLGMIGLPQKPLQAPLDVQNWTFELEQKRIEQTQVNQSVVALKNSPQIPFVWDIAFVEIFESEKDGFDIVIGNPPYVRQEEITAPVVNGVQITTDKKDYKDKLALSVYQAFPSFFGYNAKRNTLVHKIDAKSDLYIYFYLHGLSLLNYKGSFCFITSNSWLDVGYGADLQEFLLKHSHVKLILDNQVKRSFANADVNSVIVLLAAPDDRHEWAFDLIARFVMFRAPFEHIVSPVIFEEIEETMVRKACAEYRVFPIKQGSLLEDGYKIPNIEEAISGTTKSFNKTKDYIGNKWGGKYLRAPEIFWDIIGRLENNTIPFNNLIHKDYGIKTGCVDFFYVSQNTKNAFGIEDRFLVPIINSSRSIESIYFGPNTCLFCCQEDKNKLGKGTLNYIKWGEEKGFHKLSSTVAHRPFWYSVAGQPVDFLLLQFWDKRFWTPIAKTGDIVCSNNFFYGRCLQHRDNLLAQMNSSWYFMQIELFGRSNQGQGVLTTYGTDYEYVRFIDPSKFSKENIDLALSALKTISRRNILPIWDETLQTDRKALDDVIFNAIGLSKNEREEFYFELKQLVQKRIERASSLD